MCRDEFVIHLALWNLNWRNEGFFLYLFLVVGLQEFYIHIPCSSQKATKKKKKWRGPGSPSSVFSQQKDRAQEGRESKVFLNPKCFVLDTHF